MKKILLSIIAVTVFVTPSFAFNALKEHEMYRRQLDSLAGKQHAQNQRYTNYYRGKPDYIGARNIGTSSSASTSKRDIYAKKGVKFKVDEAMQEQRLKEAKSAEEKELKTQTETVKTDVSAKKEPVVKTSEKTVSATTQSASKTVEKAPAKTSKSAQMPQIELPKINNVKSTVKNLAKPALQKPEPKVEPKSQPQPKPQPIPLNGKNADAE